MLTADINFIDLSGVAREQMPIAVREQPATEHTVHTEAEAIIGINPVNIKIERL